MDVFDVIGEFLEDMPWEFVVTFLFGALVGAGLMWWYL
jgi:hypothetical protein